MTMTRFTLGLAAAVAFAALPAFAQHSGGHAGGPPSGVGMGSSHASASSTSTHGNSGTSNTNASGPKSVSDLLSQNTKLASKLQSLLPAGTDLTAASSGFKNLGQFVAAVHVSNNLGIPFDQLKTTMIGPPKESLGQAIHILKPAANSKTETQKATTQATQDMHDSTAS
jgi:hypothetical protein